MAIGDGVISAHYDVAGVRASVAYDDGVNYNYYCFGDPKLNPELAADLQKAEWRVMRVHKTLGTARFLGGGAPMFVATDLATVAALF